jgi:hypothetical protein
MVGLIGQSFSVAFSVPVVNHNQATTDDPAAG